MTPDLDAGDAPPEQEARTFTIWKQDYSRIMSEEILGSSWMFPTLPQRSITLCRNHLEMWIIY